MEIQLTRGYVAIVDDDCPPEIVEKKWCADVRKTGQVYAVRGTQRTENGKKICTKIYLHREIVGAKKGEHVDHKNRKTLDNRRENLRPCTVSQNIANSPFLARRGSNRYKGVTWHKQRGKWAAQIRVNRKHLSLGLHHAEEDAARAYDAAAREHFGEFAWTNFSD